MIAIKAIVKRMNMTEIKEKARSLGIIPGKMKKAELVHNIQIAEGCIPCYGRSNGECAHTECCFVQDCLKTNLAEQEAVDEKFQHERAKCRRVQKKLRQYREHFDQYLGGEITKREQAKRDLVQLRTKLENANFVVQHHLKTAKKGQKRRIFSVLGLENAARFCGRRCGLLVKVFSR